MLGETTRARKAAAAVDTVVNSFHTSARRRVYTLIGIYYIDIIL